MTSGGLSNHFGRKRVSDSRGVVFAVSSLGNRVGHRISLHSWSGECWEAMPSALPPASRRCTLRRFLRHILRGRLVSLNQLAIVFGILLAQVVNWLIARPVPAGATAQEILVSWNGQWGWRWMFMVTAIPSVLFLIATFLVPESPRWLARKGGLDQASEVLGAPGRPNYAQQRIDDLVSPVRRSRAARLWRSYFRRERVKVLLLGVMLAVLATVVRHQCNLQLRAGDLRSCRLSRYLTFSSTSWLLARSTWISPVLRCARSIVMAGVSSCSRAFAVWRLFTRCWVRFIGCTCKESRCSCSFLLRSPAMPCRWRL